jgi:hypothetical protein
VTRAAPPAPPRLARRRGGRWLFLGVVLTLAAAAPPSLAAQSPAPDLEFLGFRPGLSRLAADSLAREAGADSLSCQVSARDPSVTECRASLPDADAGRTVDLWFSAIRDTAAILTLSARTAPSRLDRWLEYLSARFGPPTTRIRGPITMAQWIRDRRMLRLTSRARGRDFEASVSLVDGRVLDAWAGVPLPPDTGRRN